MTAVFVSVIFVLGAFCVVLYLSQERRQRRHDEAVATLVRQITSSNPSTNTLKAMKQTAEVISDTVGKVTDTIGKSFATATGVGTSSVVEPTDDDRDSVEYPFIPDTDLDGLFAPPLMPATDNGMISPAVAEETL